MNQYLLSCALISLVGLMAFAETPSLRDRVRLSARRLEDARYSPAKVFLSEAESGGWPGDTEGRTILALVLQNAALGEKPKHLDGILRALPAHLNAKGYMGPIREGVLDEQQLSGNGWLLRGLSEYAQREKNPVLDVKPIIRSVSRNLFLPGKGRYATYPILPSERTVGGGASGSVTSETKDGWRLSSDIGCLFIGMDGLIQAQQVTGDADLKPVIEEMIARFLAIDLVAIQAQTHATLTALRGLLRYDARRFLPEVEKRFALYVVHGMTDRYENYNWFGRFDTWTEPCAIVDSVLVAHELHRLTGKAKYADCEGKFLAALCAHQRENGGFGLQKTFPKGASHEPVEHVHEAYWCCTMRGGAGLASALLW